MWQVPLKLNCGTPFKYDIDLQQVTKFFVLKNGENHEQMIARALSTVPDSSNMYVRWKYLKTELYTAVFKWWLLLQKNHREMQLFKMITYSVMWNKYDNENPKCSQAIWISKLVLPQQSFWTISTDKKYIFKIINSERKFERIMSHVVVNSVPANGTAPNGDTA